MRPKPVFSAALVACIVWGVVQARPAAAEYTVGDWERDEAYAARKKSPWGAFGLALGVPVMAGGLSAVFFHHKDTRVPGGILTFGALTVGPASGHFYVGEYTHAAWTSVGRLVLFTTGACMLGYAFSGVPFSDPPPNARLLFDLGIAFAVAGGMLILYDIIDAPFAAIRNNEKARKEIWPTVTPLIVPQNDRLAHRTLYGLSLTGTF